MNKNARKGAAQDNGRNGMMGVDEGANGYASALSTPPPLASSPPLQMTGGSAQVPVMPASSGLAGPSGLSPLLSPPSLAPQDIVNAAYGPAQRGGPTPYDDLIKASGGAQVPAASGGAGVAPALAPPLYSRSPAQRGTMLE
jgi:hypothetical protein